MFSILDGRKYFYQWDVDRKLIVHDETIKEVHFCNKTDDCSLVCEVYESSGIRLVNVPNILLQDNWRINVYGYDDNYTKHSTQFEVKSRTKPADYIYTETEVKRWETLEQKIETVENNVGMRQLPYYDKTVKKSAEGNIYNAIYEVDICELEANVFYGYAAHEEIPHGNRLYITINLNVICVDGIRTVLTLNNLFQPLIVTYTDNETINFNLNNTSYIVYLGNKISKDAVVVDRVLLTDYIPTYNGIPYIPAEEYNPATKKYVDDSIAKLQPKKNEFGLIKKIELAEEVASVNFTYEIERFVLYINVPKAAESASVGVEAYSNGKICGYSWLSNLISADSPRVATIDGESKDGLLFYGHTAPANDSGNRANAFYYRKPHKTQANSFSKISCYGGSSKKFPVGTTFELWGVLVDEDM